MGAQDDGAGGLGGEAPQKGDQGGGGGSPPENFSNFHFEKVVKNIEFW